MFRLGLIEKGEADGDPMIPTQVRAERETWMNIYQQEQKIGYVHRQIFRTLEGYRILESVFMQINTMGMVQDIRFKTEGSLYHDLTLSSFDFELRSNLFRFKVRGHVKEKILTLSISDAAGSEREVALPLKKEIHLSVGILEALSLEGSKPGDSRTFYVFDPITTTERAVKVSVLAEETISVMGRQEKARKVSIEFMGIPQLAWIGKDGTVLREKGSLELRLEQVSREEALGKVTVLPGTDIVEFVSIPVSKKIEDVEHWSELKLRLDGLDMGTLFLNGGRQSLHDNILTIRKESISNFLTQKRAQGASQQMKIYLEPTALIQSDHPAILAEAKKIVSPEDSNVVKARKLVKWVNENLRKRPVLSVPSALEALNQRMGDCNEHAVLLAALARAAGIPAQVEAGLVYQRGRFYYHAWNVLYLGGWITADSVTGQLPADVTHLRLVRGTERQIDLVGLIGKVKIEVLSYSK